MLESNFTLEQIAAAWLELWFALPRCGIEFREARAQRQAHNSRKPVGKALVMALRDGWREDGIAFFTFTETRDKDGDNPGYVLNFARTDPKEDAPALAAEIDIRGDWVRGTIIGINQGRNSYTTDPPTVRLIDPWQLVYNSLTSAITDAQRFLLEQEERERTARATQGEGE